MSEISEKEQEQVDRAKTAEQIEKVVEEGKLREPAELPLAGAKDKPLISFDFDGVVCRPPFGVNAVLGRNLHQEELPENIKIVEGPARNFAHASYLQGRGLFEKLKYFGRDPMPLAREGIIEISKYRTPVIITGRSYMAKAIVDAWLKHYKMEEYFSAIYANHTALPTRQFKLYMLRRLNIQEHLDDDGAITYYLATKGIQQLYLRQWPRNQGLPYPKNVFQFTNISEVAEHLATQAPK